MGMSEIWTMSPPMRPGKAIRKLTRLSDSSIYYKGLLWPKD